MKIHNRHLSGFTLIEIAIVLIVVGLIIGGILLGQNLIRQSGVARVATDIGKYNNAVNLFLLEFKAFPGDFSKATEYWGTANANQVTCATTNTVGQTLTCNGNGDGRIYGENYNSPNGVIPSRYEIYRAWQHLSNAKLIDGSYTGVVGPMNTVRSSVPDTNIPAGKINGSGFDFHHIGAIAAGNAQFFPGNYGNTLMFGSSSSGNDIAIYQVLQPVEAQNIDKKIDDGLPGKGTLLAPKSGSAYGNCSTTTDENTATYRVTDNSNRCSLFSIIK